MTKLGQSNDIMTVGNYVGHASLHLLHNLKFQLPSLISLQCGENFIFFGTFQNWQKISPST